MDDNPTIILDPDSLYIATNQIMASFGKFHWAFYVTNSSGHATKYHWADLPRGSQRAEGLIIEKIDQVTTCSRNHVLTFAYFKVYGY